MEQVAQPNFLLKLTKLSGSCAAALFIVWVFMGCGSAEKPTSKAVIVKVLKELSCSCPHCIEPQ
jgi:hypothetical protein